jgi:predicted O-methyltransferase YrrM
VNAKFFLRGGPSMISQDITAYLQSFTSEKNPLILEMEQYATKHSIPIMEWTGIETMLQVLKIRKPEKILEIGTAIGYSAIRMADALPNAKIVTIERDAERYEKALYYIQQSGFSSRIQLIFGDALEKWEEASQSGPYDALFIDAAKGKYQHFFQTYEKMLKANGLVITDNVLFKGLVVENQIENKNIKNLVKKIRSFNEWLMNHPDFETTILPVGDGVAISIKRGETK